MGPTPAGAGPDRATPTVSDRINGKLATIARLLADPGLEDPELCGVLRGAQGAYSECLTLLHNA